MMKLIPFETEHITQFLNYGGQEHLIVSFSMEDIDELKSRGDSWTAVKDDRIMGCAGTLKINNYRACAWGLFQKTDPRDFLFIHRSVVAGIKRQSFSRIEAFVDPKLFPAMRWIEMLGFRLERAYIPFFFPDGSGASAWAYHK